LQCGIIHFGVPPSCGGFV